jgi:hypothetical protein
MAADFPRWVAQIAIREGRNATDALRIFREKGGRVRTQSWYRLWGQAQLEGIQGAHELEAPLHLRPQAPDIQTMSTRRSTGYMQRVVVMGRDSLGYVVSKDVSLRTDRLVSRRTAIKRAVELLNTHGGRFPEQSDSEPMSVIAGFYQGTYELEPE